MRTYYLTKIDDTPAGMHPDLPLQRAIEKKLRSKLGSTRRCRHMPNWKSLCGGVVALKWEVLGPFLPLDF